MKDVSRDIYSDPFKAITEAADPGLNSLAESLGIDGEKETAILNEAGQYFGVVPHDLMHMDLDFGKLKKLGLGALGALAGAGVLAGKGMSNLIKRLLTKEGAKRVYRRIEELKAYICDGEYADKLRLTITMRDGKQVNTIRSYDQIVDAFKKNIQDDLDQYASSGVTKRRLKESIDEAGEETIRRDEYKGSNTQSRLIDRSTMMYLIGKYSKLMRLVNKDFPDLRNGGYGYSGGGYGEGDDLYDMIKRTCEKNLSHSDRYIDKLIEKFEKKFTIKKLLDKDNPGNERAVAKWSAALHSAWDAKKQDIMTRYNQIPRDICRSAEFLAMYKLIVKLYRNMPDSRYDVDTITAEIKKSGAAALQSMFNGNWYTVNSGNKAVVIGVDNTMGNQTLYNAFLNAVDAGEIINKFNKSHKTDYKYGNENAYYVVRMDFGKTKQKPAPMHLVSQSNPHLFAKELPQSLISNPAQADKGFFNDRVKLYYTASMAGRNGDNPQDIRIMFDLSWDTPVQRKYADVFGNPGGNNGGNSGNNGGQNP